MWRIKQYFQAAFSHHARLVPKDHTMRTTALRLPLLASLAWLGILAAHAQPQWRFHLAFEDGAGARDTLWFLWDTSATAEWGPGDVDYHLGEGGVEMDPDTFNVWMYNWDGDSTKTHALPYTGWFPFHGGGEIYGLNNFQLPLTIRWDHSLFEADYLPDPDAINLAMFEGSTYFFWNGNYPEAGGHSLLEEDSVVVGEEALWMPLFPMFLHISGTDPTGVQQVLPGPLRMTHDGELLFVRMAGSMQQIEVLDAAGRIVHQEVPGGPEARVSIGSWPPGLYIVRTCTTNNTWHHGKFIKMAP